MVPRLTRIASPAILLFVALLALFLALAWGGGAEAQPILDPGPVVRYGLPVAKLFVNLGGAGAIGAMVLVCFALDSARPVFTRALDVAAAAAAVVRNDRRSMSVSPLMTPC